MRLPTSFLVFSAIITPAFSQRLAEYVFIISFDGGKPAVIEKSEMPVIKKLATEGAVTWSASTIFPSKTLPSHTSMLTGLGPDKHHVLWNNYEPSRGLIKVPTIFSLAENSDSKISTAFFSGKAKFYHLVLPGSIDHFDFKGLHGDKPTGETKEVDKSVNPAQSVAKAAAAYIASAKPNLSFIHFADPDTAGHKSGWGSPEQMEAFKVSDQALGQVIKAIAQAGITESSVVIITADHGGHDKGHGDNIPDDMIIPWLVWGKSVKKNFTITQPVTTYDTAATALWLLGIPIPAGFDGKPVKQAFEDVK